MKVLIACEFSGIVREAFKNRGHDAMSCDLLPTEIPGNHYQGDVFDIINDGFDLIIAHPPCTYLSLSGNRWLKNNPERQEKKLRAIEFFMRLWNADIEKIAIENPVGAMSVKFRKPDQYIEPWQHGHKETKKTGLWLKNLPLLKPTNIVEPKFIISNGKKYSPTHSSTSWNKDRGKIRSLTYAGIATAMANQWT